MKALATFASFLIGTVSLLAADSPFEKELETLEFDYARALAAAREPIDRRHQQSLQRLLERAMQAKDIDAAVKIKKALNGVPEIGKTGVQPAKPTAKSDFEAKYINTRWGWKIPEMGVIKIVIFKANGVLQAEKPGNPSDQWSFMRDELYINNQPATISPDGASINFSVSGKPRTLIRVDKP